MKPYEKQSGVTLVEMVMVIIVMSILAVPLMNGFSTSARSLGLNDQIRTANMLAQECAEIILGRRRGEGYPADPDVDFPTWCTSPVPGFTDYTRIITPNVIAPGTDPCPSFAGSCRDIEVAVSIGGQTRATINLLVMD